MYSNLYKLPIAHFAIFSISSTPVNGSWDISVVTMEALFLMADSVGGTERDE